MAFWQQSQRMLKHMFSFEEGKNPYTVLGVSRLAPPQEIRRQYRRLVRQYHPDLFVYANSQSNPEYLRQCEHRMAEINRAYSALCG